MAVTYYYGDPRAFQGYNTRRDENSLLDYWFYPDRNYFDEVRKEAERQAEAIKKKDEEAKKGKGGGKKGGDGGEKKDGEKKDGENKEGGDKKGGDGGKKQPKVIELKVNLCCDSCARKVKRKIEKLDGVEEGVVCDIYEKKVIVKASADTKPETVLKQAQKVKKDAAMWPKKEAEKKEGGGEGGGGGGGGGKKKN